VIIEITELPGKNSYLLSLNRKPDRIRITQLLEQQGGIGFWETYKLPEVFEFLRAANAKIVELGLAEIVKEDEKEPANENDNELMNLVQKDSTDEKWAKENPLFRILNLSVTSEGTMRDDCNVGVSKISDTALVNKYLALLEISALFPRNLMFLWESRPISFNREYLNLIAIKISNRDGSAPLDGNYIVRVEANESNGMAVISMSMNAEGAQIWSRMTKENIDRQIAIVFNHSVYSYPRVMSEIKEGRSEITGNFTPEEASDLANILNSGSLPGIGVKVIGVVE
jgi:SecD/SecF fusion protein